MAWLGFLLGLVPWQTSAVLWQMTLLKRVEEHGNFQPGPSHGMAVRALCVLGLHSLQGKVHNFMLTSGCLPRQEIQCQGHAFSYCLFGNWKIMCIPDGIPPSKIPWKLGACKLPGHAHRLPGAAPRCVESGEVLLCALHSDTIMFFSAFLLHIDYWKDRSGMKIS